VTLQLLSGVVENMVEFKGYSFLQKKEKRGESKLRKGYHCLILELMDCSLEEMIHEFALEISQETQKSILLQITLGMSRLHTFGIIHRDLKPANVFSISFFSFLILLDSNQKNKTKRYHC